MPLENLSLSHRPENWKDLVKEQYEKIITRTDLVNDLLAREIFGTLIENECLDVPEKLNQGVIASKHFSHSGDLTRVSQKMRKIRDTLRYFYVANPNESVKIISPHKSYELYFEFRDASPSGSSTSPPQALSNLSAWLQENSKEVVYRELENDLAGLKYEIAQLPNLTTFWETHTRHKRSYHQYDESILSEYEEALRCFLNKSTANTYILLIGRTIEKAYVDTIVRASEGRESQVKCYKLPFAGALMNFDILQHTDQQREVLFGWGEHNLASPNEKVFLARDKGMVNEFAKYYEFLVEMSPEITLSELTHFAKTDTTTDIDCYFVGDSATALKRVIEQMPRLLSLRDVHTRPQESYHPYDRSLLDNFQRSLHTFLHQSRENRLSLIAGQTVEQAYIEAMVGAAEGQKNAAEFYRMKQPGFLMNFAIFEYRGEYGGHGHKEVLFGWGHYTAWSRDSVFLSSDPHLVGEFERYYSKLMSEADKLSASELLIPSESATIAPIWNQERVYDVLKEAPQGSEIRIFTTLFLDERRILTTIQKHLERGVNFKLILMDHKNDALLEARYAQRKRFSPQKAKENIKDLCKDLEGIRVEFAQASSREKGWGMLEAKQSGLMPLGILIQSEKETLVGLLPPLSAFDEGPMIQVSTNSPLGKKLTQNWQAYWDSGIPLQLD